MNNLSKEDRSYLARELLNNSFVMDLFKELEEKFTKEFIATNPSDAEKREHAYFKILGLRQVIGELKALSHRLDNQKG